MSSRKHKSLAKLIEGIWKKQIRDCYDEGGLCSERHVQAELYKHLSESKRYKVWVEPKMYLPKTKLHPKSKLHGKIPDLIITEGKSVIGIVEIKYNLDQGIDIASDITKLKLFSEEKHPLYLQTDSKSTNYENMPKCKIDPNILLFFAVIAWDGTAALDSQEWDKSVKKGLPSNFYHLSGRVDEKIREFKMKLISSK